MRKQQNYKLIELAIILIVFGTVAAAVVPQFTQASGEQKMISTINILQYVRSELALASARFGDTGHTISCSSDFARVFRKADSNDPGIPANPFNGLNSIRFSSEPNQGAGTHGWHYNTITGHFSADDCLSHSQL